LASRTGGFRNPSAPSTTMPHRLRCQSSAIVRTSRVALSQAAQTQASTTTDNSGSLTIDGHQTTRIRRHPVTPPSFVFIRGFTTNPGRNSVHKRSPLLTADRHQPPRILRLAGTQPSSVPIRGCQRTPAETQFINDLRCLPQIDANPNGSCVTQ
jgi:hypothetical protein